MATKTSPKIEVTGCQLGFSSGTTPRPARMARNNAVDALRGLIMIVMALDHTREFFSDSAMVFPPEDLTRTTVSIFLTRWITHFCAPVFFFTTGIGVFFWGSRGHVENQTAFLIKRGLWLIVLELTALRFAMNFSLLNGPVFLNILWALGWSMVALAFLRRLPIRTLAIGSMLVILLHDLADPINAERIGAVGPLWNVLHQVGPITHDGVIVVVLYPLMPWIAVMAAGFCFGPVLSMEPRKRRASMVCLGLGMSLAFIALRALNKYGDPIPWSSEIAGKTWLSFLRCTKYPPSLDFLLMTLGPALLILAWFDRLDFSSSGWSSKSPLLVFGRVPLFFFLLHFLLIHVLTIPFAYLRYGKVAFLLNLLPTMGGASELYPANFGYGLNIVFGVWVLVLWIMYPFCLWYSGLKQRRRDWWLSYL
jgi:uncharacterized membrane protein